jgi:hypothetical protein
MPDRSMRSHSESTAMAGKEQRNALYGAVKEAFGI